jgi:hypothetical protein
MGLKVKGFKQSTLSEYESLPSNERTGYFWLVREIDENDEIKGASIYFGNRLYASTNEIVASLKIEGDDVE